jgi:DNA-directed RNA polymerase subunit RPC12/RpoP
MIPYTCQECGATFDSAAEREQHNRVEHSQYHCDDCEQVFGSEFELEDHGRVSHPERQGISGR